MESAPENSWRIGPLASLFLVRLGRQEHQRHRAHVHPAQICSTLHTVGVPCVSVVQSLHKNALSMVKFGAAKLIVQTVQTEVRACLQHAGWTPCTARRLIVVGKTRQVKDPVLQQQVSGELVHVALHVVVAGQAFEHVASRHSSLDILNQV